MLDLMGLEKKIVEFVILVVNRATTATDNEFLNFCFSLELL